ncbi:MAG TPA: GAF domain-containing protein [Firmicutes bacterium]|nr:GAF domain-containing protein [Bacillota bacterium]
MPSQEELYTRIERLEKLVRISTLISSSLDIDTVLVQILEAAGEVMDAGGTSIMLLEEDTGDLLCQQATGRVGKLVCQVYRLPKGQGIAGWVAQNAQPVRLENVYDDPRFSPEMDRKTGFHTQSMLCVPLVAKDRLLGVAQVVNKTRHDTVVPFTSEDEELFTLFAQQAAIAIDNARLHRSLLTQERLQADLQVARKIQQSFLPERPPDVPGLELAAYYEPSFQIGGDFYDFFHLSPDELALVIGDVSGKGTSAALYMARFVSDLKIHALQERDPVRLVQVLNDIQHERSRFGMFITLIYGILNLRTFQLDYVCAGHPPLFRYRPGASCDTVQGESGFPLGIFEEAGYSLNRLVLEPDESLIWYTDGVVEAQSREGRLIGSDWLSRFLEAKALTAPQLAQRIVDEVHRFGGQESFYDDITLMVLRRKREDEP